MRGGNVECGAGKTNQKSSTMATLYDLLGALPNDDADELRGAFRRAVKRAHPNVNSKDPDAGSGEQPGLHAGECARAACPAAVRWRLAPRVRPRRLQRAGRR